MVPQYSDPVLKNPDTVDALRRICSNEIRHKFENQFRALDVNGQGLVRKDDFVNVLFDLTKDML